MNKRYLAFAEPYRGMKNPARVVARPMSAIGAKPGTPWPGLELSIQTIPAVNQLAYYLTC